VEITRGHSQGATVLVVDDERDVADLYAEYLAERHDVRSAYSGDEALEAMSPDVDIVLLDRRMPGKSGDEVVDLIRARGYNCRIVFITAVDPDIDTLTQEFDEYLVKPVFEDDLNDVVEAMLARNEYVETIEEAITLVSKMGTLEAKMDIDELERSEKYTEAQDRFHELRDEIGTPPDESMYSDLAREKLETLFE
jgi:DNA-binding response OmpR family regulator